MAVELAVTGATGRMGRTVINRAAEREGCSVVAAVSRSPGDKVAGVSVDPTADIESVLERTDPDALVDFTGPESVARYADACAATDTAIVSGTTGLGEDDWAALEAASERVPVLHAPNFARGVATLVELVGAAVEALPDYDAEILETHHNGKRDAPSGTAGRLLEAMEAHGEFTGRTHGREGEAPRQAGEIGVHALRAGDVTGEHTVLLAGNHEEVRLSHRAEDRGVFAAGAIDAAVWLTDRPAGTYEFTEVIHA